MMARDAAHQGREHLLPDGLRLFNPVRMPLGSTTPLGPRLLKVDDPIVTPLLIDNTLGAQ